MSVSYTPSCKGSQETFCRGLQAVVKELAVFSEGSPGRLRWILNSGCSRSRLPLVVASRFLDWPWLLKYRCRPVLRQPTRRD